jgi:hypothetical protein
MNSAPVLTLGDSPDAQHSITISFPMAAAHGDTNASWSAPTSTGVSWNHCRTRLHEVWSSASGETL